MPIFLGKVYKCDLLPPPAQSRASPCPLALSIVWGNFQCLSDCSHFLFFGCLVADFSCSHWKFFASFTLEFPWLQLVAVACGPCTCEKGPILPQLKLLTTWGNVNVVCRCDPHQPFLLFTLASSALALLRSDGRNTEGVYEMKHAVTNMLCLWLIFERVLRSTGKAGEIPSSSQKSSIVIV